MSIVECTDITSQIRDMIINTIESRLYFITKVIDLNGYSIYDAWSYSMNWNTLFIMTSKGYHYGLDLGVFTGFLTLKDVHVHVHNSEYLIPATI
jgi:hypothetical protein